VPHEARLRGQGLNVSVSGLSSTRLDAERRRLPPLVRASMARPAPRPDILLGMKHVLTGTGDTPVVDAATVVLVRDGEGGLECLMLRKTKGQAFGGLWVFPGGRVESGDGDGFEGLRRAAVREAQEETGLLLDATELLPFAHWFPPPEAPRRFATWFFLAALPAGAAEVIVDGGEIGDHVWTTPGAALERHRAGEIKMVPPTWVTLHRLVDLTDTAAALADVRGRDLERFSTHMVDAGGVLVAVWAPDAAYGSGDLVAAGPRHRLVMDDAGWRYQRSD
jgi:8-oxo-dGTP pyrophosphatase MutT (NUDIX family)